MRIRHFGLLANRIRHDTLTRYPPDDAPPVSAVVLIHRLTGGDLGRCPVCGEGRMQIAEIVGP